MSVSESNDFICTVGECHQTYKMSIVMCLMRNHLKKILSLYQKAKVKFKQINTSICIIVSMIYFFFNFSIGFQKLYNSATVHTTRGDIHLKLFGTECPKSVENFCVHSKNGYYNGHIFHRVIKGFMVQTGDPTGTGTGGESIWGGDFKDEFHPSLRHDRPYTLSMANAGPNTNGSQFFITVLPTVRFLYICL